MLSRTKSKIRYRKVGYQPPRYLVDAIARLHPTVRLIWALDAKAWCLIQKLSNGTDYLIAKLPGNPNMGNTVKFLNAASPKAWAKHGVDKGLRSIDDSYDQREGADLRKRAEEAVREAGERTWDAEVGKVSVAPGGR